MLQYPYSPIGIQNHLISYDVKVVVVRNIKSVEED